MSGQPPDGPGPQPGAGEDRAVSGELAAGASRDAGGMAPSQASARPSDHASGRASGRVAGPWRRRSILIAAGLVLAAAGVITLVVLGQRNSRTYRIHCGATHIAAEQGRSFPPSGHKTLSGPDWAPIPIPPSTECEDRSFPSRADLTRAYREILIARSEAWITHQRPEGADREHLAQVQTQLDQALMLSRAPGDSEVRARIERLLGDLDYWRGRDEIEAVQVGLQAAIERFQQAGQRDPRHASDTAAWQQLAERVQRALGQGPSAADAVYGPRLPAAPDLRAIGLDAEAPDATVEAPAPEPGGAGAPAPLPAPDASAGADTSAAPGVAPAPGPSVAPAEPGPAQPAAPAAAPARPATPAPGAAPPPDAAPSRGRGTFL